MPAEFARDAELSIRHDLSASAERFDQAVRRFKEHRGFGALGCYSQLALTLPAFDRKKSAKAKFLSQKP